MKNLRFAAVNEETAATFTQLMREYAVELDEHSGIALPPEMLEKWTASIIRLGAEPGRFLELCCWREEPVGFLYGKIDRPEHRGYIRPGWGYIMEFYVRPPWRRKGCGRRMAKRLEALFRIQGASRA